MAQENWDQAEDVLIGIGIFGIKALVALGWVQMSYGYWL